ncbi:bacillithiol biosynthesis cysteine-adding enzyme BshC [Bacillus sp. HMF5848]|uniref:bacillithiol biosynthesis cysteine-adding enzyme BshC n=1 Tax=Bacillus sp. HMF5848 TaxID=2495421 RepID=UPI000F78AB9F|nr:bacillithiol biosynthesis cysteine-adding enzyme BshC [Bacillus sp. HMF5848]RSK26931.1 bacillithiol biosynthesis cysteine-adding enzyme BshC [Bacillus sp. HMF5848]
MEFIEIPLSSSNKFIHECYSNDSGFFQYNVSFLSDCLKERVNDLKSRSFKREQLVEYLLNFNAKYEVSNKTTANIKKLLDDKSVVVVGGQQAGLMTGPLYTIHKIITIIQLAREQEVKLGVPVVPVFWIAGEDHDFQEINHVYTYTDGALKKNTVPHKPVKKQMVSSMEIDKQELNKWIMSFLETFGETPHTKSLLDELQREASKSITYVDFFARLVQGLFSDEGLVLIDSGDYEVRKLESPFFTQLITQIDDLQQALQYTQQNILNKGFSLTIGEQSNNAHLFYELKGERVLLEWDEASQLYRDKQNLCSFTRDELLEVAINNPELLSNNVVTRPLMQEFLFPVLAFVGGPGEIAYWAELKQSFEVFDFKMPPIIPRHQLTILTRAIETDMLETELDIKRILEHGVNEYEECMFDTPENAAFQSELSNARREIEAIHSRLREAALDVDRGLQQVVLKNSAFIQTQLDFLEKSVDKSIMRQHETVFLKLKRIEAFLKPNNAFQERSWNVYYFLNLYGRDFVKQLAQLPFSFEATHKIIKL